MTERIDEAASMASLGLDPFRYLESRDVSERIMIAQLHNKMVEIDTVRRENLAIEIASKVSQLFKK